MLKKLVHPIVSTKSTVKLQKEFPTIDPDLQHFFSCASWEAIRRLPAKKRQHYTSLSLLHVPKILPLKQTPESHYLSSTFPSLSVEARCFEPESLAEASNKTSFSNRKSTCSYRKYHLPNRPFSSLLCFFYRRGRNFLRSRVKPSPKPSVFGAAAASFFLMRE